MKKELSYLEKLQLIEEVKKCFEKQLESRLSLIKVPSPLFVKSSSGLQDELSGKEKSVFFIKDDEKFEIVHSLAKWKREALGHYEIKPHEGIYTEMKAIRKDEEIDSIHSLFVEQWDWEKVIEKDERTIEYLKKTVGSLYKVLRQTLIIMKKKRPFLTSTLPKTIYFITSEELEDLYPDKTPKEREELITRDKKAVFIIGIGDKLKSGIPHDLRSPDYDDWSLDGDMLVYDKVYDRVMELTSMGIRVDEKSIVKQLEKSDCMDRLTSPYHQAIIKSLLPYSIGGGLGESRIIMFILGISHIAEIQASSWSEKTLKELKDIKIL